MQPRTEEGSVTRMDTGTRVRLCVGGMLLVGGLLHGGVALALQEPRAEGPTNPQASATIDLTGYWVSVVSEDWRFRMVTPPKGDYTSLPLNEEGMRAADAWDWQQDLAAGLECKAFGAANLMRVPGRLHITWQGDRTLRIDTDAGEQTRLLRFNATRAEGDRQRRSRQGFSVAEWEPTDIQAAGLSILSAPSSPPSRSLQVVTTGLRAGYLRTNGVPYSEDTILTEYYDILNHEDDDTTWLVITSVVDDPQYLLQPFITTSHFKREADGSKWRPRPCEIVPPTRGPRPASPQ